MGASREMETTMKMSDGYAKKMRDGSAKPAGGAAWGRVLLVFAAALVLALATALPAEAQARRTRPDTAGSGGGSDSGSVSRPSGGTRDSGTRAGSGSGSRRPSSRPSGGVSRTRPPRGGSAGPGVIQHDRRPTGGAGPGGRYHYYYPGYWDPYWSSYRYSWWLGYGGWYGWGPYGYHRNPYGYPYGYGPVTYYPGRVREDMGALDLDLKPGDTKIYVNGQLIGVADRFDGWPRYLWLEEGDYHFIFYKEGHRAIVREYRVYPGIVLDVEDRLERGESPPPEELFPPPTARREERLRRYEEQRRRVEAEDADDWRDRSERIRSRPEAGYGEPSGREDAGREAVGREDAGREDTGPEAAADFGSLELTVEPTDASVYLDGRFLGTAADLERLRRGLTVEPGRHTLSVVRPGHEPEEMEFDVSPGESVRLDVRLERRAVTQD